MRRKLKVERDQSLRFRSALSPLEAVGIFSVNEFRFFGTSRQVEVE